MGLFGLGQIAQRFPNTTRIGSIIRAPLRLIPSGTVLRIISGPAAGMRWIVGSGVHGMWIGSYEREVSRKFAREVSEMMKGRAVYDIGANVGYYTLIAKKVGGPDCPVVAIEPLPSNVVLLRRHLQLNSLSNSVQIISAAADEKTGVVRFQQGPTDAMGKISLAGTLSIDALTLDSVWDSTGLSPGVVKIDVEGAEARVLRGAERILSSLRPMIFLALHPGWDDGMEVENCKSILRRHSYHVHVLAGASDAWICKPMS